MNNRITQTAYCPKCGGRVFLDKDYYGWYAQCLLCGHLQNLEKVSAKLTRTTDKAFTQPIKMQRTKIKL